MSVPAYRIHARIKNNRLWSALREAFPDALTQTAMAERVGITNSLLGDLLNLRTWPGAKERHNRWGSRWWPDSPWTEAARRIADAVGSTPEYLFDAGLYGQPARPIEIAIDRPALVASGLLQLPPAPDDCVEQQEIARAIQEALGTLSPREQTVLIHRRGLNGEPEKSLEEIGELLSVTYERVRQIEAKAMRKLRQPSRSKILRHHVDAVSDASLRALQTQDREVEQRLQDAEKRREAQWLAKYPTVPSWQRTADGTGWECLMKEVPSCSS